MIEPGLSNDLHLLVQLCRCKLEDKREPNPVQSLGEVTIAQEVLHIEKVSIISRLEENVAHGLLRHWATTIETTILGHGIFLLLLLLLLLSQFLRGFLGQLLG